MRRRSCAYLIPGKLLAVLAIGLLYEELDKTCCFDCNLIDEKVLVGPHQLSSTLEFCDFS